MNNLSYRSAFFNERKLFTIHLPFLNKNEQFSKRFCEKLESYKNEQFSKRFCEKLESYTNDNVRFSIVWTTRKLKSLFRIKDKINHLSCVIYEGNCNCGTDYIGKRIRNSGTRFS